MTRKTQQRTESNQNPTIAVQPLDNKIFDTFEHNMKLLIYKSKARGNFFIKIMAGDLNFGKKPEKRL